MPPIISGLDDLSLRLNVQITTKIGDKIVISPVIDKAGNAHGVGGTSDKSDRSKLLTGTFGFVAVHVLNSLPKGGYNLRGTVRSEVSANKVRKTYCHLLECNKGAQNHLTFAPYPKLPVKVLSTKQSVEYSGHPYCFSLCRACRGQRARPPAACH